MGTRTCPYCAEKIREEALKCKHCGSMMPEFEERIEEEQRQAEIEEQRETQEADAQYAQKAIYGGYVAFAIGLILGFLLAHAAKVPMYTAPFIGYIFWSAYWGIRIVHRAVKSFYDNLIIFGRGIVDLILRQIGMRLSMYLFTIPFVGLLVGAFGGAFFKQIRYQKMINGSHEEQSRTQALAFVPLVALVLVLIAAGYEIHRDHVFASIAARLEKNAAEAVSAAQDDAKSRFSRKTLLHRNRPAGSPEAKMNASDADRPNSIPGSRPVSQGQVTPGTALTASPRDAGADSMKSFVSDYLRANEKKQIDKVMSFYADSVDYQSKGKVPKNYIMKNKELFFNSWRSLSYSVPSDLKLADLDRPGVVRLTFTSDFNMKTNRKTITGTATNIWDVENVGSTPKIIAEKQTITNTVSFAGTKTARFP